MIGDRSRVLQQDRLKRRRTPQSDDGCEAAIPRRGCIHDGCSASGKPQYGLGIERASASPRCQFSYAVASDDCTCRSRGIERSPRG